jgi:hypothetical protein
MEGEKPVMVGVPALVVTVNVALLVADPFGEVTAIVPVVASAGTVTASWLAEADVTVAAVPWKVTVFDAGVALNPVP